MTDIWDQSKVGVLQRNKLDSFIGMLLNVLISTFHVDQIGLNLSGIQQ